MIPCTYKNFDYNTYTLTQFLMKIKIAATITLSKKNTLIN